MLRKRCGGRFPLLLVLGANPQAAELSKAQEVVRNALENIIAQLPTLELLPDQPRIQLADAPPDLAQVPGVAEAEWVALFSVDGSLLRQSSSMWEGFADVQVRVQSFRKSKSDWVSADSFTPSGSVCRCVGGVTTRQSTQTNSQKPPRNL